MEQIIFKNNLGTYLLMESARKVVVIGQSFVDVTSYRNKNLISTKLIFEVVFCFNLMQIVRGIRSEEVKGSHLA